MDFTDLSVINPTFQSSVGENDLFSETASVLNKSDSDICRAYQESDFHNNSDCSVLKKNTYCPPDHGNSNVDESSECNWILISERDSLEFDEQFGSVPTVTYSHRDVMVTALGNDEMTKNSITMEDLETPEDLCKNNFAKDTDAISQFHTKSSFKTPTDWEGCSVIHLQRQGNAMAKYLARLQQSSLPLSIQQFLSKVNLKQIPKTEYPEKATDSMLMNNDSVITSNLDNHSELYFYPECQVSYSQEEHVKAHMTVQNSERRFQCNICGACLKRKEHLDQHKNKHSEERPFVCKVCHKGFKRNEHLRRHNIIHSGNKFFSCSECGKSFSRKDHLNKHSQTHTLK